MNKQTSKGGQQTKRKRNNSRRCNVPAPKKVAEGNKAVDERDFNNDPSWYFGDKQLMDQTVNFSFNQIQGWPIRLGKYTGLNPGIMRIEVSGSIGTSTPWGVGIGYTRTEGINWAAKKTFAQLSASTGRTTSYTPADITMMILALGDVLKLVSYIRRIFGVMYTYSNRNALYPQSLVQSMVDPNVTTANGFEWKVDITDIANLRTRFNIIINAFNRVPIISNIPYIHKCATMFDKIYLDDESPMAQTIYLAPNRLWKLNEIDDESGSFLESVPASNAGQRGLDQYIAQLEKMVNVLLDSTTLQVVYADIINLASKGGVQLYTIPTCSEDYVVVPEYNAQFLQLVHNLTICGDWKNMAEYTTDAVKQYNCVRQDVTHNAIVQTGLTEPFTTTVLSKDFQGLSSDNNWQSIGNCVVDFDTPSPTVEERLEATRLTVPFSTMFWWSDKTGWAINLGAAPDHICNRIVVYSTSNTSSTGESKEGVVYLKKEVFNQYGLVDDVMRTNYLYYMTKFNKFPLMNSFYLNHGPNTASFVSTVGDLNFYTNLDNDNFGRVNALIAQNLYSMS